MAVFTNGSHTSAFNAQGLVRCCAYSRSRLSAGGVGFGISRRPVNQSRTSCQQDVKVGVKSSAARRRSCAGGGWKGSVRTMNYVEACARNTVKARDARQVLFMATQRGAQAGIVGRCMTQRPSAGTLGFYPFIPGYRKKGRAPVPLSLRMPNLRDRVCGLCIVAGQAVHRRQFDAVVAITIFLKFSHTSAT